MKKALCENFLYKTSEVSIYIILDDDYLPEAPSRYCFTMKVEGMDEEYTDSFCHYFSEADARDMALAAADRMQ